MNRKIKNIVKNDLTIFFYDKLREIYCKHFISDKNLIRKQFKKRMGREVEFKEPINFTDKLQWLKLNWYDPLATSCADKYEVRRLVSNKIGKIYLNKVYKVYETVDDIDIGKLPKSFVLKGTHGSGFNIICKDKNEMNWNLEKKRMRRWLKKNYYWQTREWVYKDIKPRIICEQYLSEDNEHGSLTDYKFYCFNGKPTYCQVIRGRGSNETIDFYDVKWNNMGFSGLRPLPNSNLDSKKPDKYEEMIDLAKILSENFPFVRVDFYYVNNNIYFGELTFFPHSGMGKFDPPEWDLKLGKLLNLPS